jgi:hypothetical protein
MKCCPCGQRLRHHLAKRCVECRIVHEKEMQVVWRHRRAAGRRRPCTKCGNKARPKSKLCWLCGTTGSAVNNAVELESVAFVDRLLEIQDAKRNRTRFRSLTSVHAGRPGLVSENAGPSCENSTSPGLSSERRSA